VDGPTLGVVQRHRPDQRQLQLRHLPLHEAVRGEHAERVLPGVKTTDLGHQWLVHVDPNPGQDALAEIYVKVQVLGAYGVAAGREDRDGLDRNVRRNKPAESEYRRIVALDIGAQEMPGGRVRLGGVDVATPDPVRVPTAMQLQDSERLRVMHDDQVIWLLEMSSITGGVGEIRVLLS